MSAADVLKRMEPYIGKEVFLSDWVPITQEQINLFAESTRDHQWIHVDPEKAAKGPFGKTIAHGFLTLSHIAYFAYQVPLKMDEARMSVNYGMEKVRFVMPVPVDSRIRDRVVLKSLEEKPGNRILMTQTHTIEIEGQDKPACIADAMGLYYF